MQHKKRIRKLSRQSRIARAEEILARNPADESALELIYSLGGKPAEAETTTETEN